ncbi:hypothetical protein SAMN05216368_10744 [Cryobacterium flavum]|uniref:DUF2975 domain-containing protein n=1 Tax=Cryobacterium flavum TaxID=1424659 RepID=A0A4V3I8M3_9MICO|nr:hypothetical protein [Cryobacterium flavum]TFB75541.1 hypothetical protein E3O21_11970 [Cryobacterium flavum]SDN73668.1 hypothetical protein SAMN05216368_10744 [Cryobacterium flavum]
MIIRRYWRIAVFAPFVGFLLAAVVAIVMTNAGSGETEFRFWFVVRSMANYGVIGAVIAAVALLGGLATVALVDRHLTKSRWVRTSVAAVGATLGVVLLSVVVAGVLSLVDDGAYAGITIAFGLVFGVTASVVAAVMVFYAEWRTL